MWIQSYFNVKPRLKMLSPNLAPDPKIRVIYCIELNNQ